MTECPFCGAKLIEEKREIEKGFLLTIETCPNCKDEWVDEKEHDKLVDYYVHRTFKIGESIAVRIPKKIVNILDLKEGSIVDFKIDKNNIIISKIG